MATVQAAWSRAATLLAGLVQRIPIIHVKHDAGEGSPYDIPAEIGQIVDAVAPDGDEPVIVKHFPNSFVQTDLDDQLKAASAPDLLLAGFMTHMCVNSTSKGAFDLGFATVVAPARPRHHHYQVRPALASTACRLPASLPSPTSSGSSFLMSPRFRTEVPRDATAARLTRSADAHDRGAHPACRQHA